MDFSRHLDVLDFDVAPDEELPDYEAQTAPDYDTAHYETPLFTYHLRQANRRVQIFVPYGPSVSCSYKIVSHSFRLFSKRPEMEVVYVPQVEMAEKSVASIWFDNNGPLPWRPRAHVSHANAHGNMTYAMESKNFNDWTIVIGGITYIWTFEGNPVSLVLRENNATMAIARFTYSGCGTAAMNGAEVGELTVYRDGLSDGTDGIEKIISGLMVSIVHFKRMGRQYCNDESIRASSLSRAHVSSTRSSVASSSNV
ncbi:hypothetical protein K505DRAFT_328447 [Melanomma pulvis-pyrius CBS 109.77]|uniref:Uncharacterized protein n=1 Tax=Melanomma pulvis-pyrius CBS 109.77 TaxID=1314802 RepID=A0A6A6WYI8_9PLEO|nr:hypothetical protein K505DRAFT_328447 [Melanomma pulvis-pyrius CBS 109.77]